MSAAPHLPARALSMRARGFGRVRSEAGRYRQILSNWRPRRTSPDEEAREREVIARRAEDLCDNEPHASSVIDAMSVNIVGQGQRPQSRIAARRLGISEDAADELRCDMELAWQRWIIEAHAGGRATFGDLQYLSIRSLLTTGDFLFVPRMIDDPLRSYSLALQDVHPSRLSTPSDLTRLANIHDGVECDELGRPQAYWICNPPPDGWFGEQLGSASYARLPACIAHRPGVLHGYRMTNNEQFRGRSVLAPAMKQFRLLGDSFDYELIGQIIAASFPVFIATQNPQAAALAGFNGQQAMRDDESGEWHRGYAPGQVLYGNANEKPTILESNRPGNNFQAFAQLILRSMAAATGMPYEVLSKDFSQTNYSSARAALLEAWRVFLVYRAHAAAHFCQICWNLVQEEAWLRGYWKTPVGAPDFYDARHEYQAVRWVGPARGYVDPVKEINAYIKGLDADVFTLSDVVAEQGGDWEEIMGQRSREKRRRIRLGLDSATAEAAEQAGGA